MLRGQVMSIMVPWLLAHWEEYHSGIMLYGNGYWGVTEANYLMVLLHFFTAAAGPGQAPALAPSGMAGDVCYRFAACHMTAQPYLQHCAAPACLSRSAQVHAAVRHALHGSGSS